MSAGGRATRPRGVATAAATLFALAVLPCGLAAQDRGPAPPAPEAPLRIIERSDYSRYVDGRYVGHTYREARAVLAPVGSSRQGFTYAGEAYFLEESIHDLRSETRQLDRALPLRLSIGPGGALSFDADAGIPSLRGLPAIPGGALFPGESWTAAGSRALDLDGSGTILRLPFLAECRYLGAKDYLGRSVLRIACRFATRYAASASDSAASAGPRSIASAAGTHALDIFVDAATRWPLLLQDHFEDTFSFRGGGTERRWGFTLVFFEGAAPLDRTAAEAAIRRAIASAEAAAGKSGAAPAGAGLAGGPGPAAASQPGPAAPSQPGPAIASRPGPAEPAAPSQPEPAAASGAPAPAPAPAAAPSGLSSAGSEPAGAGPGPLISGAADRVLDEAGVEIAPSQAGLVLRVRNIRFVADSEEVLPSELWRLDAIAAALKALPGRSFLVEGYSASVGNPAGELELSQRRAKRIADELAARGIPAGRFMYRGLGSAQPLAPNDTEAGRAKNRRVEITVLN